MGDWATEFREKLPQEIAKLVAEKAAAAANTDHQKSIRDRLKDILDLFKISRYRPTPGGEALIDMESLVRGGVAAEQVKRQRSGESGRPGGVGGAAGNVYAVFEKTDGYPGRRVKPDPFPIVSWVSVKDGTRTPIMSLVHACRLSNANPFEYLVALQLHREDLKTNPQQWMPWNYRATIDQAARASPGN